MDRERLLYLLQHYYDLRYVLLQYCMDCGKDVDLSVTFVNLAVAAKMVPVLIERVCRLYDINILRDSHGTIIKYL